MTFRERAEKLRKTLEKGLGVAVKIAGAETNYYGGGMRINRVMYRWTVGDYSYDASYNEGRYNGRLNAFNAAETAAMLIKDALPLEATEKERRVYWLLDGMKEAV